MLLWLTHILMHYYPAFRVFQYLSFRSIVSALTALILVLCFCPMLIRRLQKMQLGQVVRNDGPESHLKKTGTPTMGGVLILLAISVSVLLWGNWANANTWLLLFVMLGFGAIGFVDDYLKIKRKSSDGLSAKKKFLWQVLFAVIAAAYLYKTAQLPVQTELLVPFFKHIAIALGGVFILVAVLMMVGSSNAVNLTDGLDGLALMPILLVSAALAVFAYIIGNMNFASYLEMPFIPGVGEITPFCSAIVGACLGFLWYNAYPAQVFMGDVGSLGLGAVMGLIAVLVRQEIVFLIMGGVFVLETLSVILQVASFKLRGKRIFRMAPIHHHFELKGWAEPKVIVRFWIITLVLVLIGLATLKLR